MSDVERITWAHQDARKMEDELKKMDKKPKHNYGLAMCYALMGASLTVAAILFSVQRPATAIALIACAVFFCGIAKIFED